jgi:hypothetical protein
MLVMSTTQERRLDMTGTSFHPRSVYGGTRPSQLVARPPRGLDLDLTAFEDGARLRRALRTDPTA